MKVEGKFEAPGPTRAAAPKVTQGRSHDEPDSPLAPLTPLAPCGPLPALNRPRRDARSAGAGEPESKGSQDGAPARGAWKPRIGSYLGLALIACIRRVIVWRHPALVLLMAAVCLGAAGAQDGSGPAAALTDAAGASRPDPSAYVTDAQFAYAQKTLLKVRGKSKLFLLTPPGGRNKDTLLMLELNEDTPYGNGYRHGQLLAASIADVVASRYSCFGQDVLDWMRSAYDRMPSGFRDEIRGIADGMAQEGYRFPLPLVALHATQPLVPLAQTFP